MSGWETILCLQAGVILKSEGWRGGWPPPLEQSLTRLTQIHGAAPNEDYVTGHGSVHIPDQKGKESDVEWFIAQFCGQPEEDVQHWECLHNYIMRLLRLWGGRRAGSTSGGGGVLQSLPLLAGQPRETAPIYCS